jgi:hypothetical protein
VGPPPAGRAARGGLERPVTAGARAGQRSRRPAGQ